MAESPASGDKHGLSIHERAPIGKRRTLEIRNVNESLATSFPISLLDPPNESRRSASTNMKTASVFQGIYPATVSPCDRRERVDGEAIHRLAAYLYRGGVHGLFVCGGSGESHCLRIEDRKRIARCAIAASRGRGRVIVHVGTLDTRSARELAADAAEQGAQAVASMPPINRPHAEVVAYFRELTRAAGGLPVLLYHIPVRTHHAPALDQLLELLDVDGVAGVKYTDFNLFVLAQILRRRPNVSVLYGYDEQLLPALMFGCGGGIGATYNVAPRLFAGLWEVFRRKRLARAMARQRQVHCLVDDLFRVGFQPAIEAILRERKILTRCFRHPVPHLSDRQARALGRKVAAFR